MVSRWYASSCVLRHHKNGFTLVRFFLRSPPPQQCFQVGTLLLAFSATVTILFTFGNWYASWVLGYHNTALSHFNSKLMCCLCRYSLKVDWVDENGTVMVPTRSKSSSSRGLVTIGISRKFLGNFQLPDKELIHIKIDTSPVELSLMFIGKLFC